MFKTYEEWYQNDFDVEHRHYLNRLFHFIGINLLYLFLIAAILTFEWRLLITSLLSFPTLSVIGHKIIEKNEIVSAEDKKYGYGH
jgi:hypothetical protein